MLGLLFWSCGGAVTASAKTCSPVGLGAACGGDHGSVYGGARARPLAASAKAFTFTSSLVNVSCESSLAGNINDGEEGKGTIYSFTFSSCTGTLPAIPEAPVTKCSMASNASTASPWQLSTAVGIPPNGTVSIEGLTFSFTCAVFGIPVTCRYKTTKAGLSFTGGETASMSASEVSVEKEETSTSSCSSSGTVNATYSFSTPDALYLT